MTFVCCGSNPQQATTIVYLFMSFFVPLLNRTVERDGVGAFYIDVLFRIAAEETLHKKLLHKIFKNICEPASVLLYDTNLLTAAPQLLPSHPTYN